MTAPHVAAEPLRELQLWRMNLFQISCFIQFMPALCGKVFWKHSLPMHVSDALHGLSEGSLAESKSFQHDHLTGPCSLHCTCDFANFPVMKCFQVETFFTTLLAQNCKSKLDCGRLCFFAHAVPIAVFIAECSTCNKLWLPCVCHICGSSIHHHASPSQCNPQNTTTCSV